MIERGNRMSTSVIGRLEYGALAWAAGGQTRVKMCPLRNSLGLWRMRLCRVRHGQLAGSEWQSAQEKKKSLADRIERPSLKDRIALLQLR